MSVLTSGKKRVTTAIAGRTGDQFRNNSDVYDSQLQTVRLGKAFPNLQGGLDWIVRDINLDVQPGEFLTIVGPSGSGKTTILRMIAGIMEPSEGRVMFNGKNITGPSPERMMVFQSSEESLFEWLTVSQNVKFGPRMLRYPAASREAMVQESIELVGLAGHVNKLPGQLSGGMRQRLQIARALAVEPKMLVMDEPLAAVDAQTRRILLRELVRIWQKTSATIIYVTHDLREALQLGQRVVVISRGPSAKVKLILPNKDPYPRDEFSASFIDLYRQLDKMLSEEVGEAW